MNLCRPRGSGAVRPALKIGKAVFCRQAEAELGVAHACAARVMTEKMMARVAAAGIGAFVEKRSMPKWTGDQHTRTVGTVTEKRN